MKKILLLILTIGLIFSLCACNNPVGSKDPTEPSNAIDTIENLLYESDIEKIKKTYNDDITILGEEPNYTVKVFQPLGDVKGYFKYVFKDNKIIDKYFSGDAISYYTDDTKKKYSKPEELMKCKKDNMDNVKKEIENIYNSISKNMDIHSYNATGVKPNQESVEYGDLTNASEFYNCLFGVFYSDETSEDNARISRITLLGFDTSSKHAIRITFDNANTELHFTIRELPIEY